MRGQSDLGRFIKEERERQGRGLRELCRDVEGKSACGGRFSPSYLSQIETGLQDPSKTSADFLWAVGCALGIDPCLLFVVSRRHIDRRFLEREERSKLFPRG